MAAYESEIQRRVAASASLLFNEGVRLSTFSDKNIEDACKNCAAPKIVIGFIKANTSAVKSRLIYIENFEYNTESIQLTIPF